MMTWLAVFVGGGLGSVARFGVGTICLKFWEGNFPMATLVSNVLSCVILAVVLSVFTGAELNDRLVRTAILVGFCGGFSTFSTFSYETVLLIKSGNHLVAAGNMILSVGVCLILIYKLTK